MKTRKLLTTITVLSVVLIAGCKKDDFIEVVGVCPVVVSTIPAKDAAGVALNSVVTATFNVTMNPATITQTSFTVKQGTTSVAGTVSYAGKVASFTPASALTPNTSYTGTITTKAKDLAGNAIQTNYVWTFSTDASPTVITDPLNNATNVILGKVVNATFSVAMNPLTITGSTFTIKQGTTNIAGTVSYVGTVASFTPAVALLPNTVYTGTITMGALNASGTSMVANYVWNFTTLTPAVVPTVISTSPINLETDVLLNKVVTATFSVAMNPLTITGSTFTIKQGTTTIAGTVTYNGTIASFTPTVALLPNTVYTGTITTGALNTIGTALATNYVWSFTTLQPAVVVPTVLSTSPINDETNVLLNKVVTATFSVAMNPLTITGSTFTLKQGSTSIAGLVSYSGTTASFTPTVALLPNTIYTGTITTGALNSIGTALATNYVWSFTTLQAGVIVPTVMSTSPINLETNVLLNKVVTATFSVAMNPLTITGSTFTLKQGSTSIAGLVSYSGTTASFTPTVALLPNTVYTGTITTGALNTLGTALASNYVWNFTTQLPAVIPTVTSTSPIDGATGVLLNKVVTATFSVAMNPLTITGSTFTLKQGSTSIAGSVSYSGTTASFTPNVALATNTVYTGTITTGAMNTLGTPLASNYVWSFTTELSNTPDLGRATNFGAFGGNAGITNQGLNTIINNGGIGTTAASTLVTGFRDGLTHDPYTVTPLNEGNSTGGIFTAPPAPGTATSFLAAQNALLDATTLYNSLSPASKPGGTDPGSGELGGLTLAPGIYKSASGTFKITNLDLTLDAMGNPNAVWIFQTAAGLTVGIPSGARTVHMINGGLAKNVFWYVGSAAVINYAGGGVMVGTIISYSGVTLSSPGVAAQTVLNGRAISLVSSVTMVNTTINIPL